jgi:hypothetical protein
VKAASAYVVTMIDLTQLHKTFERLNGGPIVMTTVHGTFYVYDAQFVPTINRDRADMRHDSEALRMASFIFDLYPYNMVGFIKSRLPVEEVKAELEFDGFRFNNVRGLP